MAYDKLHFEGATASKWAKSPLQRVSYFHCDDISQHMRPITATNMRQKVRTKLLYQNYKYTLSVTMMRPSSDRHNV